MTVASDAGSGGFARGAQRVLSAVPALVTRLRREPPAESVTLALLLLLAAAATVAGLAWSSAAFPPVFMTLPLLLGGLLLVRRALQQLALFVTGCLVLDLIELGVATTRPGSMVVVLVTGLVAYEFARSREETGLGGLRGDSVLVELRGRLQLQGRMPDLPEPWHAQSVVKPAGGAPFSGDFVVSALADDRLEVALVDVSGKGVDAGTRSLLLSGALGGLLAATEPEGFLSAANSYLIGQRWEEGFATCVHVGVDLATGDFAVASAGHPPVGHFDAGSGRWTLIEPAGPALGLLADARFTQQTGSLRPGDALLLYTDGLVEVPGRDLAVGIDKLIGEAERLVTGGFEGGGELLVSSVAPGGSDDRGLVLIWRSP